MADPFLQLFGSYMAEYPSPASGRKRALRIYSGTSEHMTELVARGLLGRGAGGSRQVNALDWLLSVKSSHGAKASEEVVPHIKASSPLLKLTKPATVQIHLSGTQK